MTDGEVNNCVANKGEEPGVDIDVNVAQEGSEVFKIAVDSEVKACCAARSRAEKEVSEGSALQRVEENLAVKHEVAEEETVFKTEQDMREGTCREGRRGGVEQSEAYCTGAEGDLRHGKEGGRGLAVL